MVGEKVYRFYIFSYAKLKFFWNFYITEKTEKILPIFILEFFKFDFRIPGKILSWILLRHSLRCLVTSVTPLGGHFRSISNHIMLHQNFIQNFTKFYKILILFHSGIHLLLLKTSSGFVLAAGQYYKKEGRH